MDKKSLIITLIAGCLIFYRGSSAADSLNAVVNDEKSLPQTWTIDKSGVNKVIFDETGSIAVAYNDSLSTETAARVVFGDHSYMPADKQGSLLTLEFNNDARVPTALDDPKNPPGKINAHIYESNDQYEKPVNGINLAEGVNLNVVGNGNHRPVMVTYSNTSEKNSGALTILGMQTNSVEIQNQASLAASASTCATWCSSVSAGIGAAVAADSNSMVKILDVKFKESNSLTATATTTYDEYNHDSMPSDLEKRTAYAASTGIGATLALGSLTYGANTEALNVQFENNNRLTADSSSFYSLSASTGIGATSANGESMATNLNVAFKERNILTTSALTSYCSSSASTGIGATSANGKSTATNLNVAFKERNDLTASAIGASDAYYSASTGIGAASAINNSTATNLNVEFEDNNNLTASARSPFHSASTGIGTTMASGTSSMAENLDVKFGNGNNLTASAYSYSTSAYSAASVGIGAALVTSSSSNNSKAKDLEVEFEDNNNLTASATSSAYAASTGIGAALASGQVNNSGEANTLAVKFRKSNSLAVSSFSSSYYSATSVGIGVAATNSSSSTANALDVQFGESNSLAISSISSAYAASVGIGAVSATRINGTASSTASALAVMFENDNSLTVSSFSSSSDSYNSASTGIGATSANGESTANAVTVNMNGSQTLAAVAYSKGTTTVNAFGANNTDKAVDGFGWRVGIFAAETAGTIPPGEPDSFAYSALTENSTVNILAAKLGGDWSTPSGDTAVATLGASQGTTNIDYARAFALGDDFKIYIGGMAKPDAHEFAPVPANGKINVVNIVGAISKGKNSTANDNVVPNSSLTIDNSWRVNTYGPVQNLARIDIGGGSRWNVYGPASNLPNIHVQSGVLHITKDDGKHTNFNTVIGQIKGRMTYVDPTTGTSFRGSEGKININTEN
ncbi:MAG: hypothetical protein LBS22_04185, partial [Puniceicoccales bacterium]|nr:hypothetical protein [Puniceicoccales bacterium]